MTTPLHPIEHPAPVPATRTPLIFINNTCHLSCLGGTEPISRVFQVEDEITDAKEAKKDEEEQARL
jgi:hypothetical protein